MLNQHFCAFLLNNFIGSSDPNLTNNTIFFIRRSRRVRIFDPFRNLMTSKILDFPGYKGLTCNYRGLSYYDVIKKFPHAGLMRTFQISKKGVIYFRKNAKSRSTNFFPSWKLYWPHYVIFFCHRVLICDRALSLVRISLWMFCFIVSLLSI